MPRTADVVLQSVSKKDWFMSIDLKDAYFHVPLAPPFCVQGTGIPVSGTPIRVLTRSRDLCEVHCRSTLPSSGQGHADSSLLGRLVDMCPNTAILAHVTQLGLTVNFGRAP